MEALPAALQALANYPQFILWKGVPNAKGGVDKLPVDPHTLSMFVKGEDWQNDPTKWATYAHAIGAAKLAGPGHGVGFLFTANDPFYFLDIDKCLQPDNTWSPLAVELCQRLAGAAVEVSQSGRGLHIFGTGTVPEHGCKNIALGLELYTSRRFVALTGASATGDSGLDCTAAMAQIVPQYFPPQIMAEPTAWSDGPVEEWRGPDNDDELIELMINSRKGAGAIFGGKASARELWEADEAALAKAYPDGEGLGRPYDGSSADMALCTHLAFWTGKDCERIERIFNQSQLVRDKWLERDDYRQRTIVHACGLTKGVYGEAKKPLESVEAPSPTLGPPAQTAAAEIVSEPMAAALREGFQYLGLSQQLTYFAGCVYVRDLHRVFTPDGALLKPDVFKTSYGGYVFAVDAANEASPTKNAWEAFTESKGATFPKAHGICFRPETRPGAIIQEEGRLLVNTYVPIPIDRQPGDVTRFLDHVAKLLPVESDRAILLAYMAACVQYPGVKFQWWPLVQGMEGNGKTMLISVLSAAIGRRYTHLPKAENIHNQFNAWVLNKLFIGVEEVYVTDRREVLDALKPLVTNDRIEIEGKGSDQVTGDNRANGLMCSNHKDAVAKTRNDRRFCVFYTAQQEYEDLVKSGMTGGDYFPKLWGWLKDEGGYAMVTNFLHEYEIPDELNPAGACHRAPTTSSTAEALELSLGGVEQEILEAISEGRPGFAGGWISSMAFDRFLEERRDDKRIPRNKRKAVLRALGYILHPGLPGGRSNVVVSTDGGKPRLYIRMGHPDESMVGGREIVDAYVAAQEAADTGTGDAMRIFGQK